MIIRYWLSIWLMCLGLLAHADMPLLFDGAKKTIYPAAQLRSHPAVRRIEVPVDVAYRQPMSYDALPLAWLLKAQGVLPGDTIQFKAADGFVMSMPAALLLHQQRDKAQAWLAIEPDEKKWPPLKGEGGPSAGPFYLVWLNPKLGNIGPEQWPYQIARISVDMPPARRWPHIVPAADLPASHPARAGFELFVKHCFACHTLNHAGEARLGPDLNLPLNPTEYFREGVLRQFIRNNQNVRSWPDAKMPRFGPDVLTERELGELLAYLQHMAGRKIK
ncbi:MAG: hypothetical protein QG667_2379 [Pseudomonadota bacterium]|jgi:mono/diheme cytochrome c family protein|nr:hypothetical protein [Pseudomonadota bacterium]